MTPRRGPKDYIITSAVTEAHYQEVFRTLYWSNKTKNNKSKRRFMNRFSRTSFSTKLIYLLNSIISSCLNKVLQS